MFQRKRQRVEIGGEEETLERESRYMKVANGKKADRDAQVSRYSFGASVQGVCKVFASKTFDYI